MTTSRDAIHAPDASGPRDREAIEISIAPVWTIRHDGERQFDLLLLNLLTFSTTWRCARSSR
jgi:hypothetical protein